MPSLEWFEANAPNVYEPAEDTYLLLDAIHSVAADLEAARPTFVVEVGPGAGAVTSFLASSLGEGVACLAIDINPEAVRTTLQTAKDNGVEGRVACVGGDLLAPLSTAATSAAALQGEACATAFVGAELTRRGAHGACEGEGGGEDGAPCWAAADVIVFNPPYVPTSDEEVEESDIARAWAGGERGRRVIDRFLPMLPAALARPGGVALMVVVQENDPEDIARAAAALGLVTLGAVSKKARNERLSVIKFRCPLPEGEVAPPSEAGMRLLCSPEP